MGDVKLALLMGLYLGFIHWSLALFAVVIACVIGILAGAVLYFARGRKSQPFPFGPSLAAGCVHRHPLQHRHPRPLRLPRQLEQIWRDGCGGGSMGSVADGRRR